MPRLSASARKALVAEREAQILAAAARVFAAKGYERATIADIAKAAGVAEGSIYNYFKSKGDLLVSLPKSVVLPPVASLGALTAGHPPEEALVSIAHAMTAIFRENAHLFRILLSALPSMTKKMREQYLHEVVLYAAGMIQVYFEELVRRGVFRSDVPPATLAFAFVGMFFPTILIREVLQVDLLSPRDYDQAIADSVRVFVRGALNEPSGRKPR